MVLPILGAIFIAAQTPLATEALDLALNVGKLAQVGFEVIKFVEVVDGGEKLGARRWGVDGRRYQKYGHRVKSRKTNKDHKVSHKH